MRSSTRLRRALPRSARGWTARAEAAALEHRVSALDAEREIVEASAKQQAARRALEVPHAEHALAL